MWTRRGREASLFVQGPKASRGQAGTGSWVHLMSKGPLVLTACSYLSAHHPGVTQIQPKAEGEHLSRPETLKLPPVLR